MFTGIIQELGSVTAVDEHRGGLRIGIRRRSRSRLQRGESIAVNGVCLTVVATRNGTFQAELSPETLERTALGTLQRGAAVNLERALRLTDRLSGHLVQGHIDAVGKTISTKREGDFSNQRWSYPKEFRDLIVPKGSIAVNGVSLTIVEPDDTSFGAALIPETLERTNLGTLREGDAVNLEFDLIGKLVRRMVEPYRDTTRR